MRQGRSERDRSLRSLARTENSKGQRCDIRKLKRATLSFASLSWRNRNPRPEKTMILILKALYNNHRKSISLTAGDLKVVDQFLVGTLSDLTRKTEHGDPGGS